MPNEMQKIFTNINDNTMINIGNTASFLGVSSATI